jgi:hypothetical protein
MKLTDHIKKLLIAGASSAIIKQLYELMQKVPVKQILKMILTAFNKLRALSEQWIATATEFAVNKAGKLSVFN